MKLVTAIAALLAAASAAGDDSVGLAGATADPVVVTATRIPESLSSVIRPVELITGEVIERSGQQTLTELLQSQANVEITATGGTGQTSSVFLRGANSSQTLVLLDGIRLNNATFIGRAPFENLQLPQIARIEIAPGALSSLYGSDALGGVIQLFTWRWPEAPRLGGAVGYGSYDTRSVQGAVSAGTRNTGITVNAGYFETEGFSATNPDVGVFFDPDKDGYRNTNVSGSIVHRFAPDQELGASAFYTQGRTQFDVGMGIDAVNDQMTGVYSAYSRNRIAPWWQSTVRAGVSEYDLSFDVFSSSLRSDQTQASWQNDFATRLGTLIAGVEYLNEAVEGTTVFSVDERDIYSAFAGYIGEFGRHAVQGSVRNDDNSQFGSKTTGAAGYAFKLTPQLRVRMGGGTAFHAPTFIDLYDPFSGNPDLEAEEGRGWEAGVDYRAGPHRLGATYFDNRITNLIVLSPPSFVPENVSEARIKGLELGYDGTLVGLELRARLTLQDPIDESTGKHLSRRAKIFGNAGIARSFGHVRIGAEAAGAGERFDSIDESPGSEMDGYVIVNLVATYSVTRSWTVDLRWNNVLDERYELARGYNTPRSNVFLSVRYALQ